MMLLMYLKLTLHYVFQYFKQIVQRILPLCKKEGTVSFNKCPKIQKLFESHENVWKMYQGEKMTHFFIVFWWAKMGLISPHPQRNWHNILYYVILLHTAECEFHCGWNCMQTYFYKLFQFLERKMWKSIISQLHVFIDA